MQTCPRRLIHLHPSRAHLRISSQLSRRAAPGRTYTRYTPTYEDLARPGSKMAAAASRLPRLDPAATQAAVERVGSASEGVFEVLWRSDPHWPSASVSDPEASADVGSSPTVGKRAPPVIAVLDSSFNPPHYAHLAIAASALPPPLSPIPASDASASPSSDTGSDSQTLPMEDAPYPDTSRGYSARLLLFSIKNVEKVPKPGDASTLQRLEMTLLLAHELAARVPAEPVAIGLINEATFARKSRLVRGYLASHPSPAEPDVPPTPTPTLAFLIGTDTLTRMFDPRFYPPIPSGMRDALVSFFGAAPTGDGSLLISARRGTGPAGAQAREEEGDVMQSEAAREWVRAGRVRLVGEGTEGWGDVSSSAVREAVRAGEEGRVRGLVPNSIGDYVRERGLYT